MKLSSYTRLHKSPMGGLSSDLVGSGHSPPGRGSRPPAETGGTPDTHGLADLGDHTACTCGDCGGTAYLAQSLTGRTLTLDHPGRLGSTHPCTVGRPVAVATVDGATGTIRPIRGEAEILRLLGGRLTGPAERLASVTEWLAGQGVAVITPVAKS